MEQLLNKIAEVLDMSIDGVLQTYPVLRDQYVSAYGYQRASSLVTAATLLFGAWCMAVAVMTLIEFVEYGYLEPIEKLRFGITITIMLILIALTIFLNHKTIQLAPDLMFIESML